MQTRRAAITTMALALAGTSLSVGAAKEEPVIPSVKEVVKQGYQSIAERAQTLYMGLREELQPDTYHDELWRGAFERALAHGTHVEMGFEGAYPLITLQRFVEGKLPPDHLPNDGMELISASEETLAEYFELPNTGVLRRKAGIFSIGTLPDGYRLDRTIFGLKVDLCYMPHEPALSLDISTNFLFRVAVFQKLFQHIDWVKHHIVQLPGVKAFDQFLFKTPELHHRAHRIVNIGGSLHLFADTRLQEAAIEAGVDMRAIQEFCDQYIPVVDFFNCMMRGDGGLQNSNALGSRSVYQEAGVGGLFQLYTLLDAYRNPWDRFGVKPGFEETGFGLIAYLQQHPEKKDLVSDHQFLTAISHHVREFYDRFPGIVPDKKTKETGNFNSRNIC